MTEWMNKQYNITNKNCQENLGLLDVLLKIFIINSFPLPLISCHVPQQS